MKKIIVLSIMILSFAFLGCPAQKDTNNPKCLDTERAETLYKPISGSAIKRCGTMTVLEMHMTQHPDLKSKMEVIERQCEAFINSKKSSEANEFDTIVIPTIVHVIYSKDEENICNEQIASQIKVLNQDFTKANSDISQIPDEFSNLSANIKLQFELERVIRVASSTTEWGTDDKMKFSSKGGSDVVDPSKNLNIWVCNIGNGILGYAQFPGDDPKTDGIVVSPQFFGTMGSASPPFNNGRTTTHEVGHWLNLRHIWGDGNCSLDDFVEDTPISDGPNFGCPDYPILRCNSNDMTMNYMDYVNDNCMYMFTKGQRDRMRAVFASDGPRAGFVKTVVQ